MPPFHRALVPQTSPSEALNKDPIRPPAHPMQSTYLHTVDQLGRVQHQNLIHVRLLRDDRVGVAGVSRHNHTCSVCVSDARV
jgi:hypothetical protein